MGVLLEGLRLPDGNPITINIYRDGTWVNAYTTEDGNAIEVPKHGRLIDADALYEMCVLDTNTDVMASTKCINEYMQLKIDDAPTIIEAEEET